jgi:hypothetical protein
VVDTTMPVSIIPEAFCKCQNGMRLRRYASPSPTSQLGRGRHSHSSSQWQGPPLGDIKATRLAVGMVRHESPQSPSSRAAEGQQRNPQRVGRRGGHHGAQRRDVLRGVRPCSATSGGIVADTRGYAKTTILTPSDVRKLTDYASAVRLVLLLIPRMYNQTSC